MLSLKSTLLLNGISSGATGIGLVLFSQKVAALFGIQSTAPFTATGIFFVLFAALVLYTASQKELKTHLLKMIAALDLSWVLVSIVIVAATWSSITLAGNIIILVVAAWVAMMFYLQNKGTKKLRARHAW